MADSKTIAVQVNSEQDKALLKMFEHRSKLSAMLKNQWLPSYKKLLFWLRGRQHMNELPVHHDYLGGNELATSIYRRKYFLKDLEGNLIEDKPEDVFARLAAYMAAVEAPEKQEQLAEIFYRNLYEGYFLPGGRVIAGAGDMYRFKTLANCFVSVISKDNIESIYKAAYECARTYSYGGGIGVDISCLRPRGSVVHNAADSSTGSVSFMEIYSLTTGLIGQSGRRGALMLTIDVKHPDVLDFIGVKKIPNWVTRQIVEQCKWSGRFNDAQLREVERQVIDNSQVRFANVSIKVSDEFMQAVDEQNKHGTGAILAYSRQTPAAAVAAKQDSALHYSYGMPAKNVSAYRLIGKYGSITELNSSLGTDISEEWLHDTSKRDVFGDYTANTKDGQIAIRYSGDFMLYFNSDDTGEIKKLVKARDVWDKFVEGNYRSAEPGLIFWSTMCRYSPSNYVGRPIACTNPCGEVPLEDGGACNLGSINLSRFVKNSYTENAEVDWKLLGEVTEQMTRFLDNVISWNETLNPLEKQRSAAAATRRIGLGFMGVADMLNQLGIGYDSEHGIAVMEKVSRFIANHGYNASAMLSAEKGSCEAYEYEKYSKCPFFTEAIDAEVRDTVKEHGMRNIAVLSIAPTGTISNVILGFKGENNYIGVSGGVEPIFDMFYTRRSESFENKLFKVFHSTVQAYIDMHGLTQKAQHASINELKSMLPDFFFRTAHNVGPESRVRIQGICQKYIDHSISSTVNLPEDIEPEIISNIYLDAWKHGLKGITIYRDGSRYPILSVEGRKTEFQDIKQQRFSVPTELTDQEEVFGDTVLAVGGRLTTVYHCLKNQKLAASIMRTDGEQAASEEERIQPAGSVPAPNVCINCAE